MLYPTITAIVRHRRPALRDADYYDLFEETAPIDVSAWLAQEQASAQPNDPSFMPSESTASDSSHPETPAEDEFHGHHYPHMEDDTDDDSFDIHSHTRE